MVWIPIKTFHAHVDYETSISFELLPFFGPDGDVLRDMLIVKATVDESFSAYQALEDHGLLHELRLFLV